MRAERAAIPLLPGQQISSRCRDRADQHIAAERFEVAE
jgi:hypothetical protein